MGRFIPGDSNFRIERKEAAKVDSLIHDYVKRLKLSDGLKRVHVFDAWDKVTGAGRYTIGKDFRGGTLSVTISSSVVRSQLWFQKEAMLLSINEELAKDPFFTGEDRCIVKKIILK
jgi:hypothetical protein